MKLKMLLSVMIVGFGFSVGAMADGPDEVKGLDDKGNMTYQPEALCSKISAASFDAKVAPRRIASAALGSRVEEEAVAR